MFFFWLNETTRALFWLTSLILCCCCWCTNIREIVLLGNLQFSRVELSDTRTARPYVCIVENSVLRKLVQGNDQILVPRHSSGIHLLWTCMSFTVTWSCVNYDHGYMEVVVKWITVMACYGRYYSKYYSRMIKHIMFTAVPWSGILKQENCIHSSHICCSLKSIK